MKIGILTFHSGINHGAYLQAYALYKYLKTIGHEVIIINYVNNRFSRIELAIFLWFQPYFKYWATKLRILNLIKILKFKIAHLNFSRTKYTHDLTNIDTKKFDVVIFGSDEIWNYQNMFFGLDLSFFGKNVFSKNLVAYAPSFGHVEESSLSAEIIEHLRKFSSISVRDSNSKLILEKNLAIEVPIVLDPTLLIDFEYKRPKLKNYILVYINNIREDEVKAIKNFALAKKKKNLSLAFTNGWCDHVKIAVSPKEWVGYFFNADYIITNTLHGAIFSIKAQKNFVVLKNKIKNIKLNDLLMQFGLEDRIVQSTDLILKLNKEIDYKKINNIIGSKRNESIDYLKSSLNVKNI